MKVPISRLEIMIVRYAAGFRFRDIYCTGLHVHMICMAICGPDLIQCHIDVGVCHD